ncbi:hypothetical protein J7444_08045 [Labrenzia sp. R4_1]|uniref:hypothetical protein n=1 Tax=Labrenzia sp. R4_1 TaxID=2821106 RepID=UPI001ADCF5E0|nr:hypothetical protein [Labrenzia sp. R4_1]MBO9424668.1 hypothetical protein [Labrenzia sp. R4_1]
MPLKSPENRFTVGFIIAVFACFVIVILAAKGDAHPAWVWLHKWQTLVGGSFALIAATTAWTAAKNQIRHAKETFAATRIEELDRRCADVEWLLDTAATHLELASQLLEALPTATPQRIKELFDAASKRTFTAVCTTHPNLPLKVQMWVDQANHAGESVQKISAMTLEQIDRILQNPDGRGGLITVAQERVSALTQLRDSLRTESQYLRNTIDHLRNY